MAAGSGEASACNRAGLGLSFSQALLCAGAFVLATSALLYGRRSCPPGSAARVTAALVATAVNAALPALFCRWDDTTTIILTAFNFMWLSSFKALAWACGRGALCTQPLTFPQLLVVYAAPVTPVAAEPEGSPEPQPAAAGGAAAAPSAAAAALAPAGPDGSEPSTASAASSGAGAAAAKGAGAGAAQGGGKGRLGEDAGGSRGMLLTWAAKGALLAVIVQLLQLPLPAFLESFCMALGLMALLSLIMDGPAAAVIGLTGLRVSPHFDRPWMARGVASFWNKHWDLAAGNTLRQLVYDSVCDGSLVPPPPGQPRSRPSASRQLLGSLAAFAASGLAHECIFWHLTGRTSRGVWLSFFLAQVPAIALERLVLAWLKRRRVVLPALPRILTTVAFETWTAQHLFFGPVKEAGVIDSVVRNVSSALAGLARPLARALTLRSHAD